MQVTTIGLDIAKNTFQAHGTDARGRPVLRRRLARGKVLEFFATLPRPDWSAWRRAAPPTTGRGSWPGSATPSG